MPEREKQAAEKNELEDKTEIETKKEKKYIEEITTKYNNNIKCK
jgi:hypothetical protein